MSTFIEASLIVAPSCEQYRCSIVALFGEEVLESLVADLWGLPKLVSKVGGLIGMRLDLVCVRFVVLTCKFIVFLKKFFEACLIIIVLFFVILVIGILNFLEFFSRGPDMDFVSMSKEGLFHGSSIKHLLNRVFFFLVVFIAVLAACALFAVT
jgi:hypothetical protein